MARKLGLGGGVISLCVALAGCQSGGSNLATNQHRTPAGAFAKQGSTPPPNFPSQGLAGQNNAFSTSSNGAFPSAPLNNSGTTGFAPQSLTPTSGVNNPPGLPPQGPQNFGSSTTSNRNNVQLTQPGAPSFAQPGVPTPSVPQPDFPVSSFPAPPAQPGISPIPPQP